MSDAAAVSAAPRAPLREPLIVLAVGAGLGALGPFGTFADLAPAPRYAYWIGLTSIMWLQLHAADRLLGGVAVLARRPAWERVAAVGLLGAVPTVFEVAWVEGLLRVGRVLSPRALAETYACVVLVAVGLWAPLRRAGRRSGTAPASPSAATGLLALVPARLGERLLALSAEDHYLRVHTDRGDDLVHYRLSQAREDLGARGVQVHRSWWVATDAVDRAERDGERWTLVLRGGLRVPVSRTWLQDARRAGLIP